MQPLSLSGPTRVLSATTTSARATDLPVSAPQIEVNNLGPGTVFLAYGSETAGNTITAVRPTGATEALGGGYPVLAGQSKVISKGSASVVAVVSDSTATVYISPVTGA